MLIYLGFTLTYLASTDIVRALCLSVRALAAGLPDLHRLDALDGAPERQDLFGLPETLAPAALVCTDLLRAAQLHRSTGVWTPVLPPLAMHFGLKRDPPRAPEQRRVLAVRPELWRRVPLARVIRSQLGARVTFQSEYLSEAELLAQDAVVLVPWDNDVLTFYELYHAGMPLLLPSALLMTKWLPIVRWGTLEPQAQPFPSQEAPPWAAHSNLVEALAAGALTWVSLADYYGYDGVLRFDSLAELGLQLGGELPSSRAAAAALRSEVLAVHRQLLRRLAWRRTGQGTCAQGFLAQRDGGSAASCRASCEETTACVVAAFNGFCCMIYSSACDLTNLRHDNDRSTYTSWALGI